MKRSLKYICIGIISLLCVGGMVACGESRTPDFKKDTLSAPEDLYLSIRYSEEQTDYVLTWKTVENSAGYEISIDGATVATVDGFYMDEYDVTEYVQKGKGYEFGIKALGDDWEYESSETAKMQVVAEEVTEKLLYTPLEDEDGACEVEADGDLNGKVVIPDEYNGWSVTKIADYAFSKNLFLGEMNGITEVRLPESLRRIGKRGFCSSSFTEITLPNGIEELGEMAFGYCYNLVKCDISSKVSVLSSQVFSDCVSLKEMELHDNITEIGDKAFFCCLALSEITIPKSVKKIGEDVFGLSGIKNIIVSEENEAYKSVDGNLLAKDGKTFVCHPSAKPDEVYSVPVGVTKIEPYAFTDFYSSNKLDSYGDYVKNPIFNLKKVILPQGVTDIATYTFFGSSIKEIELPDGLKTIGEKAFIDCRDLEHIAIPNSVKSIGDDAFAYCRGLTSIVIPDSVTSIGSKAFSYCGRLTIYCNAASQPSGWDSDWNVYGCPVVWDCANKDVASDGYIYVAIDNIRYGIKDGVATVVRQASKIQTANIPTSITYKNNQYSVTSIGFEAFSDCRNLTSVTIPDSVTSIGDSAFECCYSLTSVTIGNSVTSIGFRAFCYCYSLTSVIIPDSVTSIGDWAFHKCVNLTSVTIPVNVTSIGEAAFLWCVNLTSVTIPDNVTSIGDYAFFNCSSLTNIIIPESVTSIGEEAFGECYNLTIYCEAESEPSGWASSWNYSNRPVYWYSETEPTAAGNYWHYDENGAPTVWTKEE